MAREPFINAELVQYRGPVKQHHGKLFCVRGDEYEADGKLVVEGMIEGGGALRASPDDLVRAIPGSGGEFPA